MTAASGRLSYFETTCAACHVTVPPTCNGCHAHGVHASGVRNTINLVATTDRSFYGVGDAVRVTVSGGEHGGWVRLILSDQDMIERARSAGPDSIGGGPEYPIVLSAPAPAKSGSYRWNVAWYGSGADGADAAFPRWAADADNPGHGREVITTNEFTVVAGPGPAARLDPAIVPLGLTPVGTSTTRTVQVVNEGDAVLIVSAINRCPGTGSEFTWTPTSLLVSPGSREPMQITYSPQAPPQSPPCLHLSTNDPQHPQMLLILSTAHSGSSGSAP